MKRTQAAGSRGSLSGRLAFFSASSLRIGTGADIRTATVQALLELNTNDYVELWLANDDSTAAATVLDLSMTARG